MFNLKKDIELGIRKYPQLQYLVIDGFSRVKGVFTAHDKKGKIDIEDYEVMIGFPKAYPYSLPWVIETSNKIPKNASRHVFSNGNLCFGNLLDVERVCIKGITFKWFLEEILNTHLCREFVREKTGVYPTGERSHGNEGTWEGYYEIFNTTNKAFILEEIELVLNNKPVGRNAACYCDSGKKYKACHEKVEHLILDIGRKRVSELYEILKQDYKQQDLN